nr:hypothetical protein [uncultured Desulfobacter sp.]
MLKGEISGALFPLLFFIFVSSPAQGSTLNFNICWERTASLEAVQRHSNAVAQLKNRGERIPKPEVKSGPGKLYIFDAGILKKVKKYVPPAEEKGPIDVVRLKSAKNEWESAQIGIWTPGKINQLKYHITDLIHENGKHVIKGNGPNIRTYFVYNVVTKKTSSTEVSLDMDIDVRSLNNRRSFRYEEEPVALLDLPWIDVEKETSQALWLDIYTPKSTPAGKYSGNIIMETQRQILSKIPLEIEVLPFELDEAREWSRGAYISKFIDKKEAENLVEHGHTQVSWWTSSGYRLRLKNGQISADFSPSLDYLKMLDNVGMTGPHTVFLGGDTPKLINDIFLLLNRPAITGGRDIKYRGQYGATDLTAPFEQYLSQTLKQFYDQMKSCGHEEILTVILDEPDHRPRPERLNWYNKIFSIVEKQVPELQTFGVFYHKDDEKKLSLHHDVWSTNCPSINKYEACKEANRKLFTYHGGFNFYGSPGKPRFSIGIIPWVYEADGTFYWAIWNHDMNQREKDDIFSPLTFRGQSTTIGRSTGKANSGPISTLIHKGFREAVDDARYIKTFEKLLDHVSTASSKMENRINEQKRWLKGVQTIFRKRLYVRGGHVQNHKQWKNWHRPVTSITIYDSFGKKMDLSDLNEFTVQFRNDIIQRILSLKAITLNKING